MDSHLQLKVIFHQRLSAIKGCQPSQVILHSMPASIKDCLPLKVITRLISIESQPKKVVVVVFVVVGLVVVVGVDPETLI